MPGRFNPSSTPCPSPFAPLLQCRMQSPQMEGHPSLRLPYSFLSFPFASYPSPFGIRFPQVQLRRLGERCKLPEQDLGRRPSGNRIWCVLALKITYGGTNFTNFPENQLTTVSAFSRPSCDFVMLTCSVLGNPPSVLLSYPSVPFPSPFPLPPVPFLPLSP